MIAFQVLAFGLGAIIVEVIGNIHKNKNTIELSKISDPLLTVVWIIGGVFLAYLSQIVASLINMYILDNPIESANTTNIVDMIFSSPMMVLVVVLFGPIIEEYVFRKAILGEIFEVFSKKSV